MNTPITGAFSTESANPMAARPFSCIDVCNLGMPRGFCTRARLKYEAKVGLLAREKRRDAVGLDSVKVNQKLVGAFFTYSA